MVQVFILINVLTINGQQFLKQRSSQLLEKWQFSKADFWKRGID